MYGDEIFYSGDPQSVPGPDPTSSSYIEEPQMISQETPMHVSEEPQHVATDHTEYGPGTTNTSTPTATRPKSWSWQKADRSLATLTTKQFMDKLIATHHYRSWHGNNTFGTKLQNAFLSQYTWHGKNVSGLINWGGLPWDKTKLQWIKANAAGAGQMYYMSEHLKKAGQKADFTKYLAIMRQGSGGRGRLHLSGGKRGTSTPGAWATDRMRNAIMASMTPMQLAAMKAAFGIK
jgi:hypothetical protein